MPWSVVAVVVVVAGVVAVVVVVAVVLATGCDTDTAGMEGGVGGTTVLSAEVVAGVGGVGGVIVFTSR